MGSCDIHRGCADAFDPYSKIFACPVARWLCSDQDFQVCTIFFTRVQIFAVEFYPAYRWDGKRFVYEFVKRCLQTHRYPNGAMVCDGVPYGCVVDASLRHKCAGDRGKNVFDGGSVVTLVEDRWVSCFETGSKHQKVGVDQADASRPAGNGRMATSGGCNRIMPVGAPVPSDDASVQRVLHSAVQNVLDQMFAVVGN